MKKILPFLTLVLLSGVPAMAQVPAPAPAPAPSTTFSLTSQAVALPGGHETVAATIVGATYNVTKNVALRSDNMMVPGSNLQAYFGGVEYTLDASKLLAKTSLPVNEFQPYVTASAGVDVVTPSGFAATQQHYAFLAGAGINYDPANTGHFAINLIEVRWAKLPGYANSTVVIASGVKLNF